ncbi:hypothetical protein GF318_03285 [Candidatus Micrarchaeota archaeon]|nr:hypothetical protein [Candidatus Micrarchaeota archaeon]
MKLKKPRLREIPKQPEPKKKKWPAGKLLLSLGLAATVGILSQIGKCDTGRIHTGEQPKKAESSTLVVKKPEVKIPPAKIQLEMKELNAGLPNFKEVDVLVESSLRKTGSPACPFSLGPKETVPVVLKEIKKKLNDHGFDIASANKNPEEIFYSLFSFYMKNNAWMMIRTAKVRKRGALIRTVGCLFRFPITRKASLSFSYFDGKLSATNVPVFFLAGQGIPEQGAFMRGVAVRRGLMVFPELPELGAKIDREKLAFDLTIHEGIHYHTMTGDNDWGYGEYDYDRGADAPEPKSKTLARQRDELRAFLIQTMYGNYPEMAFMAMLNSDFEQYAIIRKSLHDSLEHIFSRNPRKLRLYRLGRLSNKQITPEEMRAIAYDAYLRNKL